MSIHKKKKKKKPYIHLVSDEKEKHSPRNDNKTPKTLIKHKIYHHESISVMIIMYHSSDARAKRPVNRSSIAPPAAISNQVRQRHWSLMAIAFASSAFPADRPARAVVVTSRGERPWMCTPQKRRNCSGDSGRI